MKNTRMGDKGRGKRKLCQSIVGNTSDPLPFPEQWYRHTPITGRCLSAEQREGFHPYLNGWGSIHMNGGVQSGSVLVEHDGCGTSSVGTGKGGGEVTNGMNEQCLRTCCRPEFFAITVNRFSEEKKAAVREMGFGDLLGIKCTDFSRSLIKFLVDNFDPETSTLDVHGRRVKIDPKEFGQVMGVPNGELEVCLTGNLDHPYVSENAAAFVTINVNNVADSVIYLALLEEILLTSSVADNKFRVGFLLFAIATVLCPNAHADRMSWRYLLALKRIENVSKQQWGEFCFQYLLDGVRSYKKEMRSYERCGGRQPWTPGCLLFLQLFYCSRMIVPASVIVRPNVDVPPIRAISFDGVKSIVNYVWQMGGYGSRLVRVAESNETAGENLGASISASPASGINHDDAVMSGIASIRMAVEIQNAMFQSHLGNMEVRLEHRTTVMVENIISTVMKEFTAMVAAMKCTGCVNNSCDALRSKETNRFGRPSSGGLNLTVDPTPGQSSIRPHFGKHYRDTEKKEVINVSSADTANMLQASNGDSKNGIQKGAHNKLKRVRVGSPSRFSQASIDSPDTRRSPPKKHSGNVHKRRLCFEEPNFYKIVAGPLNGQKLCVTEGEAALINYVFRTDADEGTPVIRHATTGEVMGRNGFKGVGPRGWLSAELLHYATLYFMGESSSSWYLSPYTVSRALDAYAAGTDAYKAYAADLAKTWRARCTSPLSECEKIFLPIRDAIGKHWFLAVVLVREKRVEIWDSLPIEGSSYRQGLVVELLIVMEHGFRSQITCQGSTIKNLHMWDFRIETPDGVPVQPNAWDCGVFVIKFMDEHGRDFKDYKKVEWDSQRERAVLVVWMLMHPKNTLLPQLVAEIEGGDKCEQGLSAGDKLGSMQVPSGSARSGDSGTVRRSSRIASVVREPNSDSF